jgi:uncharacterized protein (TIRG00374 family)
MFWQHRDGFDRIAGQQLLWTWVGIAILLRGIAILASCVRWWLLVRAQEIIFPLPNALRLGLLGNLCNYVVPGTVGGDLTKAVLIARDNPGAKATVTATVVLDRVIGLLALLMVGAAAALLQLDLWGHPSLSMAMMLFAGGSLAGAVGMSVMLHPATVRSRLWTRLADVPKIGGIIVELTRGVSLYQRRRGVLGGCILLSVAGHVCSLTACYCCAVALQLTDLAPTYLAHLLLVPIAEVAASALPLPGGIGAREGALQYLYGIVSTAGVPAAEAGFYTAVGFSLVSIIVAGIGGGLALALTLAGHGRSRRGHQHEPFELAPASV